MPSDDTDLRGVESLAYTDDGNGAAVVLVHGAAGSAKGSWGPLAGRLAGRYRVIVPDNPGSGGTPLPDGPLDLDYVADRVARTAQDAGLERFAVVGLSMGAAIAIRLTARHPGMVTGIGLIAGFARPDARTRLTLGLWRSLLHADRQALGRFLLATAFGAEYLDRMSPRQRDLLAAELAASLPPGTEAHINLAEQVDTQADLDAITAPAVVIGASDDALIHPRHSEAIAVGIPGSRLAHVPAGHSVPVECPDHVLDLLSTILP